MLGAKLKVLTVCSYVVNKKSKMTRINITVPEDLLEQFKVYCEDQVRPLSAQIQFMMKQAIAHSEDQQSPVEEAIANDQ